MRMDRNGPVIFLSKREQRGGDEDFVRLHLKEPGCFASLKLTSREFVYHLIS